MAASREHLLAASFLAAGATLAHAGVSVTEVAPWGRGNVPYASDGFAAQASAGLRSGKHGGAGVGLTTGGDAVTIDHKAGALQTSVSDGAAHATSPCQSFGNLTGLGGTIAQLGVADVNAAFVAVGATEIGSPGRVAALSEPAAMLIGGLGLLGVAAGNRSGWPERRLQTTAVMVSGREIPKQFSRTLASRPSRASRSEPLS